MGLYCTTTALQTRLVNIVFDTATGSLASEMINDAEAEVNKFLSKRYDLGSNYFQTSTSIPPAVRALTTRLATSYMWEAMSRGSKESLARASAIEKRVLDNLQMISEYKADLVDTAGSVITDMSQTGYRVLSNTTSYANTFNEDDEMNWAVDDDKIDDIAAERE